MEDNLGASTHEKSRAGCKIPLGRTNRSIWLKIPVVAGKSLHVARRTWSFHQHYLSEAIAIMTARVAIWWDLLDAEEC